MSSKQNSLKLNQNNVPTYMQRLKQLDRRRDIGGGHVCIKTRMSSQQNFLKLNQNSAPTCSALSSLTADVTLVGVDTYA